MAKTRKRGGKTEYRWPNGSWHSRPYYGGDGKPDKKHPAKQPATPAKPHPTGGAQAPARPAPPKAPTAPAMVNPFFDASDLQALNEFVTNMQMQMQEIDFGLNQAATDTAYQKGQVDSQAKQQHAQVDDSMISRGLFRSSIRDAATYDVEAQRSLQQKFLDDKMTALKLNAGTTKNIIAQSKQQFDAAQKQKAVENARPISEANNAAYADLQATYAQQLADWKKKYDAPKAGQTNKKPPKPQKPAKPQKPTTGANTAHGVGNTKKPGNKKPGKKKRPGNGTGGVRAPRGI